MNTDLQPSAATAESRTADGADVFSLEMSARRDIQYQIVHPAHGVFDRNETTLVRLVAGRPVLFVVDANIDAVYGADLRGYAAEHLDVAGTVVIQGDEVHKTWTQVETICGAAIACKLGRHAIVIGVGGGVTLDVAGFAASIYRRGIAYLRIPTTLIGQVDVSIGVKQGINAGGYKNILGSFYAPVASINDVAFLRTLPREHLAAGLAEILKIALIRDAPLFDLVETYAEALLRSHFEHPSAAARLIMERAELGMLRELEDNLFETGLKRPVDFGHTFSPAIETASRYTLSHGYAVALDMLISTFISLQRGLCAGSVLLRLLRLCRSIGLPITQTCIAAAALHQSLDSVRAHRGGSLNLVVPTEIGGCCFVQDVALLEVQSALAYFDRMSRSHAGVIV